MDTLKARIDAVLRELRGWQAGEAPVDIDELAARHSLDSWVVRRLAESEGVTPAEPPKKSGADEDTQRIDPRTLEKTPPETDDG